MLARIAMASVLGLAFTSGLLGQEQKNVSLNLREERRIDSATVQRRQAAAQRALDRVVPEVKLNEESFSDAIDQLRDLSGANFFVNWRSLESVGVNHNTPVSLHMRNQPLFKVLDVVLAMAETRQAKLSYGIDDVITISTADDLAKNVVVQVYDVRPLLDATTAERHRKQVTGLLNLLMNQVDPPTWKDRGGSVGAMRELQGQLIVTQTPQNQRRIASLIHDLAGIRA